MELHSSDVKTTSNMIIILAIASSVSAAVIAGAVTYSMATEHSRQKYTELIEQHYIQEHLKPDELTIVRVGESSISQPLADGLMYYGAGIVSYPGLVIPGYLPSKDAIYVFEDIILREGRNDDSFHEFLRNASAQRATIVAVGENSEILYDLFERAGIDRFPRQSNSDAFVTAFKLSESGGLMIMEILSTDGKDLAISIMTMAREEEDHVPLTL